MKVKVRTADFRFSMPLPVSMAGFALRWVPDRVFEEVRSGTPEPYASLITKETIGMILGECLDVLRENKGLEMVHVEASDGTFVSITL